VFTRGTTRGTSGSRRKFLALENTGNSAARNAASTKLNNPLVDLLNEG